MKIQVKNLEKNIWNSITVECMEYAIIIFVLSLNAKVQPSKSLFPCSVNLFLHPPSPCKIWSASATTSCMKSWSHILWDFLKFPIISES